MLSWLCPALPPTVDPLSHESRALLLVGLLSSFKAEDSCLRRVRSGILLSGSRLLHACIGRADKTYTTSYGCLQHILKTGGVQLLYKGVFANSVRAVGRYYHSALAATLAAYTLLTSPELVAAPWSW